MAERGTVFQTTQLAVETTPGTTVPAIHRLLAVNIEPKPMTPIKPFRNEGSKFVSNTFNPKEWTQGDVKGEACYRTMSYLLSMLLTSATITTPGGGTLSRLWTFQPNTYSPDTPKAFTVESGSSAGAERFPFCMMDTLALRITKDEVGITGAVFGQKLAEGITLTPGINAVWTAGVGAASAGTYTLTANSITTGAIAYNANLTTVQAALDAAFGASQIVASGAAPTYTLTFSGANYSSKPWTLTGLGTGLTGGALTLTSVTTGVATSDITPIAINPSDVQILVATTFGGSYTALTKVFETDFSITNRFTRVMTLDNTQASYSAVVEKAPDLEATFLMEHDTTAAAYMTQLRNSTTLYGRILATSPNFIEGAIPWQMQIDFPFRFKESNRGDKEDVWCSTYKLQPMYDATAGYALKIAMQNDLTAL